MVYKKCPKVKIVCVLLFLLACYLEKKEKNEELAEEVKGCLQSSLFYGCALLSWGVRSKSFPAVTASCTLIRTSSLDVLHG